MKLTITEVNYFPKADDKGRFGFVAFVINKCIKVTNVAVYGRLDGNPTYRLAYPKGILFNGDLDTIVFPIERSTTNHIEKVVTVEINKLLAKHKIAPLRVESDVKIDESFGNR